MERKKVLYVIKEGLHLYPPCISQILHLKDAGLEVTVICGACDEKLHRMLVKREIECIILGNKRVKNKLVGKVLSYTMFRSKASKVIKDRLTGDSVMWIGTTDCAMALIGKFKNVSTVHSALELYDYNRLYHLGTKMTINRASLVVACEENRARIMKIWYGLNEIPSVLPNKPYSHPRTRYQKGTTEGVNTALEEIKRAQKRGEKIILYQGIISKDRDLSSVAQALKVMNEPYLFVLIGEVLCDDIGKLKSIYENTVYLGYFPAPLHLQITSYAHIGVASYDNESMNNMFCAPNKIYEYTGFGIPVLGNNVPGLQSTIGAYTAGECVDFDNVKHIIDGINRIERYYTMYSKNANRFYKNTDNNFKMREIISKVKNLGIEKNRKEEAPLGYFLKDGAEIGRQKKTDDFENLGSA